MPNFESPLGNKKFPGQPMREFDVPDESEPQYAEDYASTPPIARRPRPNIPQIDMNEIESFQQKDQMTEQEHYEIERQIREAKQARLTGKERLNEGAKRRIEMLVGMTRSSRDVTIGENTFVLQTLRSKEMREAIMAASEYDGTVQSPFEIRRQLLARSLVQVAGIDIAQFVGSNALEARLSLVDDLDEALLNRLYEEYLELVRESRAKYAIKTPEEVQEVVEDLKK